MPALEKKLGPTSSYFEYSGDGGQLGFGALEQGVRLLRCVTVGIRIDTEADDVGGANSQIDMEQVDQALQEQTGGNQQDDGDSDLRADQRLAQPHSAARGRRLGSFIAERGGHRSAGGVPSRIETEEKAGEQGEAQAETEYRPVEADGGKGIARIAAPGRQQQLQRSRGDAQTGRATGSGQQQSFGEELRHQVAAPCAHGRADG
jgi:hypothetical protein